MQSGQSPKQTFVKRHKPFDMMLWKYFIIIIIIIFRALALILFHSDEGLTLETSA